MSLYTFKNLIIEVKRYTDVTGLLVGRESMTQDADDDSLPLDEKNSEKFKTVFELQFHTKLFPVVTGDRIQLVIGVNTEELALEDVAEYIVVAKVVQTNGMHSLQNASEKVSNIQQDKDSHPSKISPHFIASSGGMIGRVYIPKNDIQTLIDVGNDCRFYLNKL